MLSYRHAFHAGNFADLHKHAVLALVLEALRLKAKPFFVLDSHAGAGRYDLNSPQANKLGEWRDGIGRYWPLSPDAPLPALYRQAMLTTNADGRLRHYPGSPAVIRQALRPSDRAVLVELHNTDRPLLERWAADDRRLSVQHRDGFEAVTALVPPVERRGLVLVDPPYEVKTDYTKAADVLIHAHRKWATGTFALWYPLLAEGRHRSLLNRLEKSGIRRILVSELLVGPQGETPGMYGSGMVVVNPPWRLDTELKRLLPLWAETLDSGSATWKLEWLVPE